MSEGYAINAGMGSDRIGNFVCIQQRCASLGCACQQEDVRTGMRHSPGQSMAISGFKGSFELGLLEQDVLAHTRVILDERQLLRQNPWVLLLDIEVARARCAQQLDQDSGSLALRHLLAAACSTIKTPKCQIWAGPSLAESGGHCMGLHRVLVRTSDYVRFISRGVQY